MDLHDGAVHHHLLQSDTNEGLARNGLCPGQGLAIEGVWNRFALILEPFLGPLFMHPTFRCVITFRACCLRDKPGEPSRSLSTNPAGGDRSRVPSPQIAVGPAVRCVNMVLGAWWVADPTVEGYHSEEPPSETVPGVLREVARGRFVLETIGFLGEPPVFAGRPPAFSDVSKSGIWGADREGTCYSLLEVFRVNAPFHSNNVFGGYEEWRVGWLAKGSAWVTPTDECTGVLIRIDDLHRWALYFAPNNVDFDSATNTLSINMEKETLGSRLIGGANVSLVRGSRFKLGGPEQDPDRHFSFANVVSWSIGGPVTLREAVEGWGGHLESFARFMTMEPSVLDSINCSLKGNGPNRPLEVDLVVPRLLRNDQAIARQSRPHNYLTTFHMLQTLGFDPMNVLARYWDTIVTGDAYMAMTLHLESQDRLLDRSAGGALLNAIRSVESLYAAQNPDVKVERVAVQAVIDDAVFCAGDIGTQIVAAWPALCKVGELRRHVAHGKERPGTNFGLRCLGGATALQWIQRVRFLAELGIDRSTARSVVSDNFRYRQDLTMLQNWAAQIGK